MNILVLGANGYIGSRLVERLIEAGHHVRGLVQDEDKSAPLEKRGMEVRVGDISHPEASKTLTRDIEIIFDLIGYCRTETKIARAILEDGTRSLVDDAKPGQLKKFIFASNLSVYGNPQKDARLNEKSPTKPGYPVGQLTLAAEGFLLEELPTVIIRVASVYGPGRDYLQSLKAGTLRLLNDGENWQSRIHREDLVSILIAAMELADPGEIFIAADDAPTTQKEFFHELALALRVRPPLTLEAKAARAVGGAMKALGWFSGKAEATLNENVIGLLTGNYYCLNDKVKAQLGIQLRYPSYLDGYEEMLKKDQPRG